MRVAPDGSQDLVLQATTGAARAGGGGFEDRYVNAQGSLPNGLAFDADGDFLVANFGTDALEHMARDGRTRTLLDRVDGQPLGKANFVARDTKGRLWLTVTTRTNPWTRSVAEKIAD